MRTGTRRMWSRRVLRAGWALAPVLRVPAKVWNFFFEDKESTMISLAVFAIILGVGSCTRRDIHMDTVSTAAEIEEALKGNACMIDLVPRRQAIDLKGKPLHNRDLARAKYDCDAHWEAVGQLAEQKATLKRLGAK